jgi:hypothetical protein
VVRLSNRHAAAGLHGRFHFLDEHRPARVRFQAHELDEAAPNGEPRQEALTLDQRLFKGGEGQVIFSQRGMEMRQAIRTCGARCGPSGGCNRKPDPLAAEVNRVNCPRDSFEGIHRQLGGEFQ